MFKVTLKAVYRTEQEVRGKVIPKLAIKIEEPEVGGLTVDDRWLTTFNVKGTESWDKTQTVTLAEVTERNGYLNFKPQDELVGRVEALEKAVFGNSESKEKQEAPKETEEVIPDDIGF